MYTNHFNFNQKRTFLKIAEDLLLVDGEIDEKEEICLLNICQELSLIPSERIEYDNDKINEIFNTKESQKLLYIELLLLAYSNHVYSEEEKKFIHNIFNDLKYIQPPITDIDEIIKEIINKSESLLNFISED